MIVIGVDPGLSGAVGVLKDGRYVSVADIPVMHKGYGTVKTEVDAAGLYRLIQSTVDSKEACEIALERVSAMPGQGSSSIFSFGDTYGVCRAVAAVSGLPLKLVTPASWKKHFTLTSNKEESRSKAIRLFPGAPLELRKHADRAEALLIARYVWETEYA